MANHSQETRAKITALRAFIPEHAKLGAEVLRADSGNLFPFDFLAVAALNRSLCLTTAFCDLIEARNFVAAAPIIRLQLDNLLRLHAAHRVSNPHDFASEVLKGTHVDKLTDRDGTRMTDRHLADTLGIEYEWVPRVYENTSGYVHLSEKHIFNALGRVNDDGTFQFKVSATDEFVSDDLYLEAVDAFGEITHTVFRYLYGWAVTKEKAGGLRPPPDAA